MSSDWNPCLVVAAVIRVDGDVKGEPMVLIQQRTSDNHPECTDDAMFGWWEFPGGKVDYGEDLRVAVEREIMEELHEPVDAVRLLYAQVNTYGSGRDYLVLFYECIPKNLKGLGLSVSEDVRFVQLADLKEYRLLPGAREALEAMS